MSVSESDHCSLHDNQLKNQLKINNNNNKNRQLRLHLKVRKFAIFLLKKFALFYSFL